MSNNFEVGGKGIWIGRHTADEDILVFDPSVAQPASGNVSFFSLTRFRTRSFTPHAANNLIDGITESKELASAKRTYKRWPELKAQHEEGERRVREAALEQRRNVVSERHEAFLASRPSPTGETAAKPAGSPRRRRNTKCGVCHRDLDHGLNLECAACAQRICTCGACSC